MKITQSNLEDVQEAYWAYELQSFVGDYRNTDGFIVEIEEVILFIKKIGDLVLSEESAAKEKINNIKSKVDSFDELQASTSDLQKTLGFRRISYKSLFLLAHSIFENRVVEFSLLLHEYHGCKQVGLPKLHEAVDLYEKYLKDRLHNFSFKDYLSDIEEYAKIRNVLAHRKGLLSESEHQKHKDWIESKSGIRLIVSTEKYKVEITHSTFIIEYLSKIKFLLEKLVAAEIK